MAMSSILNNDDIKKALDAFAGELSQILNDFLNFYFNVMEANPASSTFTVAKLSSTSTCWENQIYLSVFSGMEEFQTYTDYF